MAARSQVSAFTAEARVKLIAWRGSLLGQGFYDDPQSTRLACEVLDNVVETVTRGRDYAILVARRTASSLSTRA